MLNEQLTDEPMCEMILHQLGMKGPTQMTVTVEVHIGIDVLHRQFPTVRTAQKCFDRLVDAGHVARVWQDNKMIAHRDEAGNAVYDDPHAGWGW